MPSPYISIALATYNGSEYLGEQLQSIAAQTRQPDEMVICDDGSTDDTLEIVGRFTAHASFPVRIFQNSVRLGFADNFLLAASKCEGDYVAYCDQDNVWSPRKLEASLVPLQDPSVLLVMHSATLVDRALRPTGRVCPYYSRNHVYDRLGLDPWAAVYGMAMLFPRKLLQAIDPVHRLQNYFGPKGTKQVHDIWTYFLARLLGKVACLRDRLILYRQHGNNTCGALPSLAEGMISRAMATGAEDYRGKARLGALYAAKLMELTESDRTGIADKLREGAEQYRVWGQHLAARAALYEMQSSRLSKVLTVAAQVRAGAYARRGRGGLGSQSLAKDLASALRWQA